MPENPTTPIDHIFQAIAIDDEGRSCRDIPDSACQQEAGNFFRHVCSLGLTKSGDGLIDPKLVLSSLLSGLGAPAGIIGMLVPVREAGALLPQMFTAGALRRLPQRKWAWSAAALGQGLAVAAMAAAALMLEGAAAGAAIVGALTVFALARSVASVTYKDVLGKTVDKSRRGRATGLAGSLAAVTVLIFAGILVWEPLDKRVLILGALSIASVLWVLAAVIFAGLTEQKGATEGGANAIDDVLQNLSLLKQDHQLVRFIIARGLLTTTALAPPFMIASGSSQSGSFEGLGFLVFASAAASLVSSFVWGSLADRSSRKVLLFAAIISAVVLAFTAFAGFSEILSAPLVLPVALFVLMIAYQGVRLGRSTHLVDMATEETRAAYTALSNTIIGVVLIAGGLFGVLASLASAEAAIAVMAIMAALAAPVAWGLDEVQR